MEIGNISITNPWHADGLTKYYIQQTRAGHQNVFSAACIRKSMLDFLSNQIINCQAINISLTITEFHSSDKNVSIICIDMYFTGNNRRQLREKTWEIKKLLIENVILCCTVLRESLLFVYKTWKLQLIQISQQKTEILVGATLARGRLA